MALDVQLKSGLPDGFDPNIWGQDPNIDHGYPRRGEKKGPPSPATPQTER